MILPNSLKHLVFQAERLFTTLTNSGRSIRGISSIPDTAKAFLAPKRQRDRERSLIEVIETEFNTTLTDFSASRGSSAQVFLRENRSHIRSTQFSSSSTTIRRNSLSFLGLTQSDVFPPYIHSFVRAGSRLLSTYDPQDTPAQAIPNNDQATIYLQSPTTYGPNSPAVSHVHHHYPEPQFEPSSYFPMPVEGSLERKTLLAEMHAKLNEQNTPLKDLAIVGVTGSGKTELAKVFAENYQCSLNQNQNRQPFIYFVDARSGVYLTSMEGLARSLGIDIDRLYKNLDQKNSRNSTRFDREKYERALSIFIQQGLQKIPHWLLIFDNVESLEEIQGIIPRASGLKGTIVYTSQDVRLFTDSKRIDTTPGFSDDEAIQLLENLTQIKDQTTALNLAKALDRLPLAIQVAGRYIAHQREEQRQEGNDYSSYLDLYEKQLETLDQVQEQICQEQRISRTQFAMIKLTVEKLSSPGKALLDFCSAFGNKELPEEFLRAFTVEFLHQNPKYIDLDEGFKALRKYGLINLDNRTNKTWSLHQITHNYAWVNYRALFSPTSLIITQIENILKAPSYEPINGDRKAIRRTFPHIVIFLTKLKTELAEYRAYPHQPSRSKDTLLFIHLWTTTVCNQEVTGGEQEALLTSAISLFDHLYGRNNPKTATLLKHFAVTHKVRVNPMMMITFLEQGLSIERSFYGENHPELIDTLFRMSNAHFDLGNISQSQDCLYRALVIIIKNGDGFHIFRRYWDDESRAYPNYSIQTSVNKVSPLRKLIKLVDRLEYDDQFIDYLQSAIFSHGSDPKNNRRYFLKFLHNLFESYWVIGKYNINLIPFLNHLGALYIDYNRAKEAKAVLNRSLSIIIRVEKGKNRSYSIKDIISPLKELSKLYGRLGDTEQEQLLLKKAQQFQESINNSTKPS